MLFQYMFKEGVSWHEQGCLLIIYLNEYYFSKLTTWHEQGGCKLKRMFSAIECSVHIAIINLDEHEWVRQAISDSVDMG